jgi:hypothetical protein
VRDKFFLVLPVARFYKLKQRPRSTFHAEKGERSRVGDRASQRNTRSKSTPSSFERSLVSASLIAGRWVPFYPQEHGYSLSAANNPSQDLPSRSERSDVETAILPASRAAATSAATNPREQWICWTISKYKRWICWPRPRGPR